MSAALRMDDRYMEDLTREKAALLEGLGDLSAIRVPLNRILLAIYRAPEVTRGGIIRPTTVRDEDIYQGVAALVVKLGPHCYEANDAVDWVPEDKCAVGDWVMFRRGEGFRVRVGPIDCILMESERGIKMVLDRPDRVF